MRSKYFLFFITAIELLLFLFFSTSSFAINYPNKPANTDFYVDDANLISPPDRAQINQIIAKLWADKHVAMIVVTIPSLASKGATSTTVEGYTRSLFDFWGLGSQQNNNGILLLVSKGDRHARIELGQSWGHQYDTQANAIMQNDIVPQFKQGNFSTGILNGVKSLSALANGVYTEKYQAYLTPMQKLVGIIGIIVLIGLIISLFRSGRSGWGWALIAFLVLAIWWILRNIRIGGGSGGMFGGGSSGGGGFNRSW